MKNSLITFLLFLLCATSLKAQLKDFEISEMPRPEVPIVQANTDFPEDALIIVYSSFDNLGFRSSMGMIDKQSFNPQSNRFEIFVKPFKQNIFVFSSDFMEGRISTINPKSKDVFYFKVEEKKTALINQTSPGKLTINTNPTGANISLNGISITDKTPFIGELNPGPTRIQLSKTKYLTFDTLLNIESSINEVLTINLKPSTLWLNINSNPTSAKVELDGVNIGTTPLSKELDLSDKSKQGQRIVKLTLPNYAEQTQTIQVYPSKDPLVVNVDLKELEGSYKIESIDSTSRNELVAEEVIIPNSFSPNGDGVNDVFEIKHLGFFETPKLRIFNRWGILTYESDNYKSDWNGEDCPAGTYYYTLDLGNKIPVYKGSILISR